jgi:lipoate-protein ligase A
MPLAVSCNLFPLLGADGPTQMAADEDLLESAAAGGCPALRFYTWDPPTLSLGYFQSFKDRVTTLPVVRRTTGGGAIVHDRELTYGFALPPGPTQKGPNWACRMHEIIREALTTLGVTAAAGCGTEVGRGAFLCFQHQTPGDLLLDGHKIGGSAQRRRAGALLQHGSILLAASSHAPQLRGVRELTSLDISPKLLADAVARSFAQATGWSLVPTEWTADRLARRQQIISDRYANPAWTERR